MSLLNTLRHKNFLKVFTAGVTSELGSFITDTALVLYVFQMTNSKSDLGTLKVCFLVFLTLGSLLGGPLGEKFNRKKILIYSEFARIPFVILLFTNTSFITILIAQAAIAFFTGIFRPARQALINEVTPLCDIKAANSLQASSMALIHLFAPVIGASLFIYLADIKVILLLDGLTYLIGILILSRVHYIYKENKELSDHSENKGTNLYKNFKEGISYLKIRSDLREIYLNSFSAGLAIGILLPLILPFTLEILGKTKLEYGYLMSVFGLGGFVGGTASNYISKYYSPGKLTVLGIIAESVIYLCWIHTYRYDLSLVFIFLWGCIVFIRISAQLNYISNTVPTLQLTKVFSLNEIAFVVPNILGNLFVSLYGDSYPIYPMMLTGGLVLLGITILRFFGTPIYQLYLKNQEQVSREVQAK